MRKISLLIILAAVFVLTACMGSFPLPEEPSKTSSGENPEVNKPTVQNTPGGQGSVYTDVFEVLPGKTADELILHMSGNLPSACSKLTFTASLADGTNTIEVVAYSTEPSDKMCAQMLSPFDEQVLLPGLKEGTYDIKVNGELNRTVSVPLVTEVPAK